MTYSFLGGWGIVNVNIVVSKCILMDKIKAESYIPF